MDCDILDDTLTTGFSPKWRLWIQGCLSLTSFAILVNGSIKGWVLEV